MNYATAKDALDWIMKNKEWKEQHGIITDKTCITFFGGEPTLLWDEIIAPLTEYRNSKYSKKELTFSITTNGTLLNKERLSFMKENEFGMLLSIDGGPDTQNINRPCHNKNIKSFDLIVNNIPDILYYYPWVTFRSTIDQSTVDKTFENYIFAEYMGFKNMFMMPNGRDLWSEKNLNILKEEFKKIYMYMISYFQIGRMPNINFSPINDSFTRIKDYNELLLKLKQPQQRKCVRCGLGTGLGSVGYDGKFYGCQEQDSKELESHFYIGDIYNGINIEKHSALLQEYLNISKTTCGDNPQYCLDCPLDKICGELNCPSSSYDLFQDFGKDNYVHCYWFRLMHEFSTITLKYLENNLTFQEYLYKNCHYDFLKKGE